MGIPIGPVGKRGWGGGVWFFLEASYKGLTAFQLHDTCLDVHGEILQVHGAGQCQGDSGKRRELNDAGVIDWGDCCSYYQKPVISFEVKEVRELVFCEPIHVYVLISNMEMEAQRDKVGCLRSHRVSGTSVFLWSLSGF